MTGGGSLTNSTDDEVIEQDKEGSVVDIEELDCNKYHTEWVSITLEAMKILENRISSINDIH